MIIIIKIKIIVVVVIGGVEIVDNRKRSFDKGIFRVFFREKCVCRAVENVERKKSRKSSELFNGGM